MTVSLKSHIFRNELYLARFHAAGASGLIFITGNLSLEFMTRNQVTAFNTMSWL
jgi:hypothetical protein